MYNSRGYATGVRYFRPIPGFQIIAIREITIFFRTRWQHEINICNLYYLLEDLIYLATLTLLSKLFNNTTLEN